MNYLHKVSLLEAKLAVIQGKHAEAKYLKKAFEGSVIITRKLININTDESSKSFKHDKSSKIT